MISFIKHYDSKAITSFLQEKLQSTAINDYLEEMTKQILTSSFLGKDKMKIEHQIQGNLNKLANTY